MGDVAGNGEEALKEARVVAAVADTRRPTTEVFRGGTHVENMQMLRVWMAVAALVAVLGMVAAGPAGVAGTVRAIERKGLAPSPTPTPAPSSSSSDLAADASGRLFDLGLSGAAAGAGYPPRHQADSGSFGIFGTHQPGYSYGGTRLGAGLGVGYGLNQQGGFGGLGLQPCSSGFDPVGNTLNRWKPSFQGYYPTTAYPTGYPNTYSSGYPSSYPTYLRNYPNSNGVWDAYPSGYPNTYPGLYPYGYGSLGSGDSLATNYYPSGYKGYRGSSVTGSGALRSDRATA